MTEGYFIPEGEIMSRIFIKTMRFGVEHIMSLAGVTSWDLQYQGRRSVGFI